MTWFDILKARLFDEHGNEWEDMEDTHLMDGKRMSGKSHTFESKRLYPIEDLTIRTQRKIKMRDRIKERDARDKEIQKKHPSLERAGVSGFSKPKRTPNHPTKSHVVVVRDGKKVKTIRFGEQGADTVTEKNPTGKRKKKRASFKARHAKNIKRGKTSAAYWADKVKWKPKKRRS